MELVFASSGYLEVFLLTSAASERSGIANQSCAAARVCVISPTIPKLHQAKQKAQAITKCSVANVIGSSRKDDHPAFRAVSIEAINNSANGKRLRAAPEEFQPLARMGSAAKTQST